MVNRFCDFLEQVGLKRDQIFVKKTDDVTVVTFPFEGESGVLLLGQMAFLKDGDVFVQVVKDLERKVFVDRHRMDVLVKLNKLKEKYISPFYCGCFGPIFFYNNDKIFIQLALHKEHEFEDLKVCLGLGMKIAENDLVGL